MNCLRPPPPTRKKNKHILPSKGNIGLIFFFGGVSKANSGERERGSHRMNSQDELGCAADS